MANHFDVTSRLLGDPEAYRVAADNVKVARRENKNPAHWRVQTEIMSVTNAILGFREASKTDEEALLYYRQDRGINFAVVAESNWSQAQEEKDEIRFLYEGMFRIAEIALRIRAQLVKEKRGWLLEAPVDDNRWTHPK